MEWPMSRPDRSSRYPAWRWTLIASLTLLPLVAAACSDDLDDITLSEVSPTTSSLGDGGAATTDETPAAEPETANTTELGLIRIDQFGYRPNDTKVAVAADPEFGLDAEVEYRPGSRFEVRRWTDDRVVFEGEPESWSAGATDEQSGDRGWWFDFSTVDQPGSYYIADPETGEETGRFEIADDVYDDVLDAALRMFWFNRANTAHPEEIAGPWADEAAYVGPDQDTEARSVDDQTDPSTALDLSGGWFDAGDTNKYVTFASEAVHLLLTAYRQHPTVFDDAVGIPESGNGIPDVVDEVRWEVDWLKRMQLDDGGVLTKVGLIDNEGFELPSRVDLPRYYEEVCSSSTIAAAGMMAHAAVVFATIPELADEADELETRAERAWRWYQTNQIRDDCDPQLVRAGDADLSVEAQRDLEVVAAVYLFALTEDPAYGDAVSSRYDETLPFTGDGFGNYGPDRTSALLFYRDLPSADPAVIAGIDDRLDQMRTGSPLFGFDPDADLYRSFMPNNSYHWGSNMVKANVGSANLAIGDVPGGEERALAHLNYFHGINPLGVVYLSNMNALGAERSVQSIFHFWFGEQTIYDVSTGSDTGVPPGYLVGGPNQFYSGADSPPAEQPPLKSYRDWSASGSEPSWEITEPAIYYQAAYVHLLAAVLSS